MILYKAMSYRKISFKLSIYKYKFTNNSTENDLKSITIILSLRYISLIFYSRLVSPSIINLYFNKKQITIYVYTVYLISVSGDNRYP